MKKTEEENTFIQELVFSCTKILLWTKNWSKQMYYLLLYYFLLDGLKNFGVSSLRMVLSNLLQVEVIRWNCIDKLK